MLFLQKGEYGITCEMDQCYVEIIIYPSIYKNHENWQNSKGSWFFESPVLFCKLGSDLFW